MSEHFDYEESRKRLWASLEIEDYAAVVAELKPLIEFLEDRQVTEYVDYIEYQFLLHQVYSNLKDSQSAIAVLKKLNCYFLQHSDARMLKQRGVELYIKTWTYLGYLLSENGEKDESLITFAKCLPLMILMRGADSQEVETVKWYIHSVKNFGQISTDEPEWFLNPEHDEEGMRCSFCLTGQVDVISGPRVCICRHCINNFNSLRSDEDYTRHLRLACGDAACSFMCENATNTSSLFPGAGVFICADCLDLCENAGDERTLPIPS